ncbi:MAG: hypothetical protein ACR2NN_17775 [Bryobacteraceae bacterium]
MGPLPNSGPVTESSGCDRQILVKIAGLGPERRETELRLLLLISGLRGLEKAIEQETAKMPLLDGIMDHKVFGPKIRKAKNKG